MRLVVPPPIQGLVFAGMIWGADRLFPQFGVEFPGQKYLAAGFALAGAFIEIIAVIAFYRAKTTVNPLKPSKTNRLVIDGLYRFSRNPMYLGLLFFLTGWSIWLGNPMAAPLLALYVGYITWSQIKPEEKALGEKFGAEYDAYCRRVRRWI